MGTIDKEILIRENGKPFFRIEASDAHTFIKCWWVGYTDFGQVMEGSELIIHFAKQWNKKGLLVDSTAEEGPWNDSNNWIIHNWMPRAFAVGIEKIGIVMSKDIFSVLSAREHSDMAKDYGFNVTLFNDENQALQWLN